MIDFGTALRRAREAAGLTLDDIFARTRINLRHLRAIESGDFPSVPQTYIRAFIREYARAVGLDEAETLRAYNEMAEAHAGIPRPPDAIDNSNILPQRDDSIEIVSPADTSPVHVEVVGSVEVEDFEPFVPPVRKSASVTSDQETIDIRTVALRSELPSAPVVPVPKPSRTEQKKHKKDKRKGTPPAPAVTAGETPPPGASAEAEPPVAATPAPTTARGQDEHLQDDAKTPLPLDAAVKTPVTPDEDAARIPPTQTAPRSTPSPFPVPEVRRQMEDRPAAPLPRKSASDDESEQRRILLVGSVIVLIVVIAIYAFFHFGSSEEGAGGMIDSTAIRASIDAGKFIDSSQNVFVEPELPLPDTAQAVQPAEETAMEPAPQVFARDDSLVLEAFSNAPVWFSVRMDTTRTERGQLSSNDHRVWKARDRFVITLGDAGAVTFFLNGREIGALGEEGAVVKNVTLSRQNTRGDQ